MGIRTGLHVYGYLKPTLTLSLVEGGTLDASTKYYVVGFYSVTPNVYNGITSPISDVYEITTTSTEKSIEISYKTYRDIQGFSDNGDGRTLVSCTRHCLGEGDEIEIEDGSSTTYSGTQTVDEWVDYDSFIIDVTYVDDYSTTSYNTGIYNNPPTGYGVNYSYVRYYVSKTNPLASDGNYSFRNFFSAEPFINVYNSNPATIKAPIKAGFYGGDVCLLKMHTGHYKDLKEEGSVFIYGTSGSHTLADIYQEIQDSGFTKNCSYTSTGGFSSSKDFFIHGSIKMVGSTTYLTDSYCSITILGGEISGGGADKITLNYCSVLSIPSSNSSFIIYTSEKGVFWNNAVLNAMMGYVYGDNVFGGAQRFSQSYNDEYTTYVNLKTSSNVIVGVVKNKIILPTSSGQINQVSYDQNMFENCELGVMYLLGLNDASGNEPNRHYFTDCIIERGTIDRHILYYSYKPDSDFIYTALNVDVDTSDDNVKIVTLNVACNVKFSFYRELKFVISDEDGNRLEDVDISVVDSSSNTYSGSTDSNGSVSVNYIEQVFEITKADGRITAYDADFNTFYSGVDVTISKQGYETQYFDGVEELRTTGAINMNLTLKKAVPEMINLQDGNIKVKANPENYGSDREILI
jgi:hypothetical protein